MKNKLVYQIKKYKQLISNEPYESIISEMLTDLKESLLEISNNIDINYTILETFHNIKNSENVIDDLNVLEDILTENTGINISNIKISFLNKHEKIIQRDKKWLNTNKKKILEMNFDEVELEVLSDYKVTFEQLINRHNIFDKIFINSENDLNEKLRRFEDKNSNLKNGLDNYFRTGTSRREIGLRKIKGDEAKFAVENMVAYCESFLSGKHFLEEKMNNIIVAVNDATVKESLSPIETLKIILEKNDPALKEIEKQAKDLKDTTDEKNGKKEMQAKEEVEEDIPEDPNAEEDVPKNPNEEEVSEENEDIPEDPNAEPERGIEDRQIGVTVLLTVAEARYFDYINVLKGLIEE